MGTLFGLVVVFLIFLAAWAIIDVASGAKEPARPPEADYDPWAQKPQAPAKLQKVTEPGPRRWIARFHVTYIDLEGTTTQRVIRVVKDKPGFNCVEAWCELRQDYRTFHYDGMRQVADPDTGEIIDLDAWLMEQKEIRRAKRQSRS